MDAATPSRMGRKPGRITAVVAVTLLLAGAATAPAAAERADAVRRVNGTIGDCFSAGGDATVVEFVGIFVVGCQHGSGFGWYQIVE